MSLIITDNHLGARARFPGDTFQFLPSVQELLSLQTETSQPALPAATAARGHTESGPLAPKLSELSIPHPAGPCLGTFHSRFALGTFSLSQLNEAVHVCVVFS